MNSKSQRNPPEFGLPVHQPVNKGGTQVLAGVNQLRLSCERILLPWEFVSARMMNSKFKTAKYTADWKEENRLFQPQRLFSEKVLYKTNCLICKLSLKPN